MVHEREPGPGGRGFYKPSHVRAQGKELIVECKLPLIIETKR